MKIKGTPHMDGDYTIAVQGGPKWARKLFLALMVAGNRKRVLHRTDRYVRFGP